MLPGSYGASALGKAFRRPIVNSMSSFEGTTDLASDAMKSTMSLFRNGRSLSSINSRSPPSSLQRTWQPKHGIVFNGNVPYPRLISTVVSADIDQDLLLHSNAVDNYIIPRDAAGAAPIPTESVSVEALKVEAVTSENIQRLPANDPAQDELPLSTTKYQMMESEFRSAKLAELGTPESYWSHTLYRGPAAIDGSRPKVKVHYCKSKHTTETVCKQYFQDKEVLGFDIEWKPESMLHHGPKKNVSLIQLACEDRIALFHIALYPGEKLEDLVAPSLKKIMEDPTITKVGVAIKADCTRIRKHLNIHAKGLFELSHLYKLVKYSNSKESKLINKRLVSLSLLVQEHLHLPLFKGNDVRSSDWSLPIPLQMDQIIYSAADSYAGIHLFDTLEIKRKALDPTPPRPYHAEEDRPIRLAEGIEIPTDEELDPEESEPSTTPGRRYPRFSSTYLAKASESVELEADSESVITLIQAPSKPKTPKTPRPVHPLVADAVTLAETYRSTHPKLRAMPSSLRCYFLWYSNEDLSVADIAGLLREIPLQTSTVTNYILEAIRTEKLPYDRQRLQAVLSELPVELVKSRYRTLAKACGIESVVDNVAR